jgi:glycosyltransferase involved in cell wall biosynthesis
MTDNGAGCLLFAVSSLGAGGAERIVAELANAHAQSSGSAGVLTLSREEQDHYRLGDTVARIALDLIGDSPTVFHGMAAIMRRSRLIRRAVRAFGPAVVVSFVDRMNVNTLVALLGTGIPVIVSERTDPRRHRIGTAWEIARRLLYPTAARVVVQTESVATWARRLVPADRVRVIPNFVRDLPTAPDAASREPLSLLAVGRLGQEKGFDVLLRAFAASGAAARGARLTILGEGPERGALAKLAGELEISQAVEMPGVVKDPERWMTRCSVFVLSSRYEGFPNVLLEAMAMGCPVIATDCDSGPREIVRSEENGLLVPPEDVGALAAAIRRFLGDAELRQRLGGAALAVRQRFAKDAILRQWYELIGETTRHRRLVG